MRILKINTLPSKKEAWVDRDDIMLHACFQLLKDCVEKENVDTSMDYQAHFKTVEEIRFLYNWWEQRSKEGYPDDADEDQAMLQRLIDIRQSLWT